MGRKNKQRRQQKRRGRRQGGGSLTKKERQAQTQLAMNELQALFQRANEQFIGRTISGIALDSNSMNVCIHVEEHNKVLMFEAQTWAIGEHAGRLDDMLLNAGFIVPEVVQRSWNEEITGMVTDYTKAVIAEEEAPESVDGELIQQLLGPYYKPEEAAEKVAELKRELDEKRAKQKEENEAADLAARLEADEVEDGETTTDHTPMEQEAEA